MSQIRSVLAQNLKQTKVKSKKILEEKNLSGENAETNPEVRYYNGMAKAYGESIKLIDSLIKSSRDLEVKNFYPVISIGKTHLADRKIESDLVKAVSTLCGVYLRESLVILNPVTKEKALTDEHICLNCRRSALKSVSQ